MTTPTIAIHGGAGTISRASLNPTVEARYTAALAAALAIGHTVLAANGKAVDAAAAAVASLEDSPLFNAGCGSVLTGRGTIEMDAAVMSGDDRSAGAVTLVTRVKNPVLAALALQRDGRWVLLAGDSAEAFAQEQGVAMVPESYFFTDERYRQLLRFKHSSAMVLDHTGQSTVGAGMATADEPIQGAQGLQDAPIDNDRKFGTVGAVALDAHGNLGAASSTGGLTNKRYGRIGDTPIVGAGLYADNASCAMAATGTGETFLRAVAGHEIACLVRYAGLSLADAANRVMLETIPALGGSGGLIAIDRLGNVAMPFNSSGMYRGVQRLGGAAETAIFKH